MNIDTHVAAPPSAPVVPTLDELETILVPAPGERVIFVPQCSYHLVDLAERGGMVGLTVSEIEPLMTPLYGAPSWNLWRGTYGRHELPIGYAMLVVRDGVLRKGLQNWDSGD